MLDMIQLLYKRTLTGSGGGSKGKCVAGINREGLGKAKIVRNNGNKCTTKFYVIFKI